MWKILINLANNRIVQFKKKKSYWIIVKYIMVNVVIFYNYINIIKCVSNLTYLFVILFVIKKLKNKTILDFKIN